MKYSRTRSASSLVAPALVVPALLAFATPAAELAFRPEAGATVTMTIEQTSEISLDEMTIAQNGSEIDPSMLGDIEMTVSSTQTVTLTDEYMEMSDGRPAKLKRTFDALGGTSSTAMSNPMMGDNETDAESTSELEGASVLFTWNADEGGYDVAFDGEEGDPELLEGLDADLTLRGFLPDDDVSEGDTWEVPAEAMRTLLAPGGELKLNPEESDDPMMGGGPNPSPDKFLKDIEGTVTATYKGNRDEDGVNVAVIALEFSVNAAADMTEEMAEAMAEADMGEEGMEMEIDAFDLEFAYEGEGMLFWNAQAGVAHGCSLSGEMELIIDQAMNMTVPGMGEMSMEQGMTLAGSQEVTLSAGE